MCFLVVTFRLFTSNMSICTEPNRHTDSITKLFILRNHTRSIIPQQQLSSINQFDFFRTQCSIFQCFLLNFFGPTTRESTIECGRLKLGLYEIISHVLAIFDPVRIKKFNSFFHFRHHMRSMRQMNSMMNSMFSDPFGMFDMHQQHQSALTGAHHQRHAPLMPFGFSGMPNMNRFMNLQIPEGSTSYSSSQVVNGIA